MWPRFVNSEKTLIASEEKGAHSYETNEWSRSFSDTVLNDLIRRVLDEVSEHNNND